MSEEKMEGIAKLISTAIARPFALLLLLCILMGFYASVAITFEFSTAVPYLQSIRPWKWSNLIAYGCTVIAAVLLSFANWRQASASMQGANPFGGPSSALVDSAPVKELPTRNTYSEEVMSAVASATSRIYLAIHTLAPARSNERVLLLQKLLMERALLGCDIRVLAPQGPERVEAAFELREKGIPTRHLQFMEDEDLRFSLIDSSTVIISTRSDEQNGQTSVALRVQSERLTHMLGEYFLSHWNRTAALGYRELVSAEAEKLLDPSSPMTPRGLASRLGIPERQLRRSTESLLGASLPLVLLIGRPGSGKSTAARLLHRQLLQADFPFTVDIRSDYGILHAWSRSPERGSAFKISEYDGFRVLDPGVLDAAVQRITDEVLAAPDRMHIVEFARANYSTSLSELIAAMKRTALVVYVRASLDVCLDRNERRKQTRLTPDSGYVPADVISDFYLEDDLPKLQNSMSDQLIVIENPADDIAFLSSQLRQLVVPRVMASQP
jgi:tRNA uridine 5-carbamoylmethylation protein Kti12